MQGANGFWNHYHHFLWNSGISSSWGFSLYRCLKSWMLIALSLYQPTFTTLLQLYKYFNNINTFSYYTPRPRLNPIPRYWRIMTTAGLWTGGVREWWCTRWCAVVFPSTTWTPRNSFNWSSWTVFTFLARLPRKQRVFWQACCTNNHRRGMRLHCKMFNISIILVTICMHLYCMLNT